MRFRGRWGSRAFTPLSIAALFVGNFTVVDYLDAVAQFLGSVDFRGIANWATICEEVSSFSDWEPSSQSDLTAIDSLNAVAVAGGRINYVLHMVPF